MAVAPLNNSPPKRNSSFVFVGEARIVLDARAFGGGQVVVVTDTH